MGIWRGECGDGGRRKGEGLSAVVWRGIILLLVNIGSHESESEWEGGLEDPGRVSFRAIPSVRTPEQRHLSLTGQFVDTLLVSCGHVG